MMILALRRLALLLPILSLALVLDSCSSSPTFEGLPRNLPTIDLHGSAATPAHSMEKRDYPFDEKGDYMTTWAALAGPQASSSDLDSWRKSHGGSVSKRQPSVKKIKSSTKSRSSSYTIKSGDTLSAIARRNNTTVAKIKKANGMSSDFIRAGKSLKIPK